MKKKLIVFDYTIDDQKVYKIRYAYTHIDTTPSTTCTHVENMKNFINGAIFWKWEEWNYNRY